MRDFRFSNELSGRNKDAAAGLLVQPRLWIPGGDYPDHLLWVDKAVADLESERKRAMIAYSGNEPVGEIIYQRSPEDPAVLELRNLSVERQVRGRLVASFLLRQTEIEAIVDFPGVRKVVGDTKRTNVELIAFLIKNGYRLEEVTRLSGPFAHNGVQDVVFVKDLALALSV